MRELRLVLYRKGFALTNYYTYWRTSHDGISELIYKMTGKHKWQPEQLAMMKGYIGKWSSWIKKEMQKTNLHFDIVVRALGSSETEINTERPMHLLCKTLAEEIQAEFAPDLIYKIRKAHSQTELGRDFNKWRRGKNVEGTYGVSNLYYSMHEKSILVIDDIITTGATLIEIAKMLNFNNNKLYFLVLGESSYDVNRHTELYNWMFEHSNS